MLYTREDMKKRKQEELERIEAERNDIEMKERIRRDRILICAESGPHVFGDVNLKDWGNWEKEAPSRCVGCGATQEEVDAVTP